MKIIAPGQQISVTAWKGGKKTDTASIVVTDKSGASVTYNNVGSVGSIYTTYRLPGTAVPAEKLPVTVSFRINGSEVKKDSYGVKATSTVPTDISGSSQVADTTDVWQFKYTNPNVARPSVPATVSLSWVGPAGSGGTAPVNMATDDTWSVTS